MLHVVWYQRNTDFKSYEILLHTYENGQNPEHSQHQMLTRMWSNRNAHLLLVGTQSGTNTSEDSVQVSYETKHTHAIRSSSHAPQYLPTGVENYSHTKTCNGYL